MAEFLAGVIAGIAAFALLLIVLTPSRRVRAEARLDREVETRLLLGVDPEPEAADEFANANADQPHDYGAAELQALRQIGVERSSSRKSGKNRG